MAAFRFLFTRLVAILLVGFLHLPAWPQIQPGVQASEKNISEAAQLLEQRYGIRIFYRAEWFSKQKVQAGITELPINQALEELVRGEDLKIIPLRGSIFLIPSSQGIPVSPGTDQMLSVGNPNEFGRFSKATVTGQVFDGSTGEPLFGAVILEMGTGRGASANTRGEFSMELPTGEIRLRVSYIGYEERIYPLRVFGPGSLELNLFASSTQLDEVTIMARRAGENLESSRMGVVYLDAKALKELPVTFGEKDIVRTMTLLPGVQTIGEFGSGYIVRGSSTDQNLILIENVPLFNPSHMFGLISVINPDLISSASLIKSGTPARYGERAASVLEIKLGNGLKGREGVLKGGLGVINSRLLVEVPVVKEKLSLALGGRVSYPNLFLRRIPAEDLYNSSAGFYDINGLVQFSPDQKDFFTLFGYQAADRFSFMGETDYAYASTLGSLKWNHIFGPRASTALMLGFSNYVFQTSEVPELNPTVHFRLNSGVNYQTAKWSFNYLPNPKHKIEFGLSAVKYRIDPGQLSPLGRLSGILEGQMPAEQAMEYAAYLSDDFSIGDRISLEAGLRFNHYQYLGPGVVHLYQEGLPRTPENITDSLSYGPHSVIQSHSALEPRISLRVSAGSSSSVKLSFTSTNQYIFLISNTSIMGPADLWKLSDSYLKPLRSEQFALGYYRNFRENSIEFSAEGYYKFIPNAHEYKSGAEIAMNQYIETDMVKVKGYNYGLELMLSKPAGKLSGWASYTYSVSRVRSDSRFTESQINQNLYFPTNFDRPHNLVINTSLGLSRRWRFGATFTYNTGRPVTLPEHSYEYDGTYLLFFSERNKYRLPDYHRLDVSISLNESLRLTGNRKSSFTFSIMNLYGRKNPHSVFYKKNPGGMWENQTFKFYQMYIISRPIPTLTLNFSL